MPLNMESTQYSLVKGERIVSFVLTIWLRDFTKKNVKFIYTNNSSTQTSPLSDVGYFEKLFIRRFCGLSLKLGLFICYLIEFVMDHNNQRPHLLSDGGFQDVVELGEENNGLVCVCIQSTLHGQLTRFDEENFLTRFDEENFSQIIIIKTNSLIYNTKMIELNEKNIK